ECRREQGTSLGQRDAARTQIKQRALVELADGGTVGGLHFVGVDLQLRLGVDLGTRRQQQVLVAEVGVAAVGAGRDHDRTAEHATRAIVGDAAPGRFGGGVQCLV